MKILVTGGSGFIGSNFIEFLLNSTDHEIINLDKLTYAGQGQNIEHMGLDEHPNYDFINGDICDKDLVKIIFSREKPDYVFNFAAESHVDRSLKNQYITDFAQTNIIGTLTLLETARKQGIEKFIHISTDEVYGSIEKGSFDEDSQLNPSNPYAISKAAAEGYALFYAKEKKLPLIITRSANNYGPYQFPEKLMSLFITNLIDGKKVPLMWSEENPGLNVRDWLYVKDNVRAIWHISQKGKLGEIYNIAGNNERTNIEITRLLLDYFGLDLTRIEKIPHRKAHDFRYSINDDKLKQSGFQHQYDLKKGMLKTIQFYQENPEWWGPIKELK
jgi:dTDP-glucose 4,6-dehydratase